MCARPIPFTRGIVCTNFSHPRGIWPPCEQAWCGKCFWAHEDDPFPVRCPVDEEGTSLILDKDKDRFMFGRAGDHLVTPFQCETCHFRNLLGRDIQLESCQDRLLVIAVRRATLDAFWSRECLTVQGNCNRSLDHIKQAEGCWSQFRLCLPTHGASPFGRHVGNGSRGGHAPLVFGSWREWRHNPMGNSTKAQVLLFEHLESFGEGATGIHFATGHCEDVSHLMSHKLLLVWEIRKRSAQATRRHGQTWPGAITWANGCPDVDVWKGMGQLSWTQWSRNYGFVHSTLHAGFVLGGTLRGRSSALGPGRDAEVFLTRDHSPKAPSHSVGPTWLFQTWWERVVSLRAHLCLRGITTCYQTVGGENVQILSTKEHC